jgi:hypothetical protein
MNRDDVWWRTAFVVCCALLVAPLWVTDWLPLVDLPQHAAQIALGQRWSDPGFDYPQYFEINWLANSFAPNALAYVLAIVFPVLTALKFMLCLALLGIPIATWRVLIELESNRWWVFAVFPVAYGYAFAWGFLGFVLAAPLGIWLILAALRYRANPTRRRALLLGALCYLLFACHVLVLAYAGLAALAIVTLGAPTLRTKIYGATALASVMPIVLGWWIATKLLTTDLTPHTAPLVLAYGIDRFPKLMSYMLGAQDTSLASVAPALVFIAVPFVLGARAARAPWRWAPLASALLFHFLVPLNVLDTAFVYPRFTLFILPGLLVALEPAARERTRLRFLPVAITVLWLAMTISRYYAFGVESRGIAELIDQAEPNKRLLSLIDNPRSEVVPWSPYLHVGCWYQVRHGGISDFSFAEFFPNRFRYRPGMDPPLPYNVEWVPQAFQWPVHGGALYDYFLIRHGQHARWAPFVGSTTKIELVARYGDWRLYRQSPR